MDTLHSIGTFLVTNDPQQKVSYGNWQSAKQHRISGTSVSAGELENGKTRMLSIDVPYLEGVFAASMHH